MNRSHPLTWILGLLTVLGFAFAGASQEMLPPPKGETLPSNPIEVQTRGPLHEAYAQPFEANPQPGTVIPKEPPAPINEEPPQQKLNVENSQWVPGYWAWDPERRDFTWVSGIYRTPPQGRSFVPGYWSHTSDGWRWIAGYWSGSRQQESAYAPDPPDPLNVDPSTPAPNANSMFIPGTWVYRDSSFLWRPGYWSEVQVGRVWVPPHYVWTPAGYVYVDGYWDYPLENRGLVFAPANFNQPLAAGAVYRPDYVVNYPGFLDSGYYLPGSGQFYFGNYSNPRFARLGYQPWYAGANRYNPVFAYYGSQNGRNNPNWLAGVRQTYAGRANGTIAGPPLTLAQQNSRNAVVVPLNQFRNNQVRLVQATTAQFNTQKALALQTRQVAINRSQHDAAIVAGNTRSSSQGLAAPFAGNARGTGMNAAPAAFTMNTPRVANAPIKVNPSVATPRTVAPTYQPPRVQAPAAHIKTPAANQPRVIHTPAPAVHHAAPPARTVHASHAPSGGHAAHHK